MWYVQAQNLSTDRKWSKMNYWKAATFGLLVGFGALGYVQHTADAQSHRKARITVVGTQGFKDNLPFIMDLDGLEVDIPAGTEVKGFSCLPAVGTDYNGKPKAAPQCYVISQ